MQRRWTSGLLSLFLCLPFFVLLPTASAENIDREAGVKCKKVRFFSQTAKQVERPNALLKRGPKRLTLETNCGEITIRTNFGAARVTLTAIAALISADYYDNTVCHRLTTDGMFVIQCGDPSATGYGEPGFTYRDENLPLAAANNYPRGTVAMANSGRPSTNGGQFFLVYEDTTLPPNYTIWGQITSGMEILDFIAAGGVRRGGTDGMPVRALVIEKIEIR